VNPEILMNVSDDEGNASSPGKAWATTGFFLGIAVSVAGNVAHTYHPTATVLAAAGKTAAQWRPELGAQLGAAFFPLALLVTVEVLARVQWPHKLRWSATRYGGAALVATVAAVVSYLHLRGLLLAYGEDPLTATIGPLSVDGLMVVSGLALLAAGRAATPAADPAQARPEAAAAALTVPPMTAARPVDHPSAVLRAALSPDLATSPGIDAQRQASAPGAQAAPVEALVSASDSPRAIIGAPKAESVVGAVRALLDSGVEDPATIAAEVPAMVGRQVPRATIDRARRRLVSEAAAASQEEYAGAYL
jgi:uncharacterized protein DUF2637